MKKVTVDQSKVLKNRQYRLFRYFWATRYRERETKKYIVPVEEQWVCVVPCQIEAKLGQGKLVSSLPHTAALHPTHNSLREQAARTWIKQDASDSLKVIEILCTAIIKEEIHTRISLILNEREKKIPTEQCKNDQNRIKNKEVMTFWNFTNFRKTLLDQSLWIFKWASWCHSLTILYSFHIQKWQKSHISTVII